MRHGPMCRRPSDGRKKRRLPNAQSTELTRQQRHRASESVFYARACARTCTYEFTQARTTRRASAAPLAHRSQPSSSLGTTMEAKERHCLWRVQICGQPRRQACVPCCPRAGTRASSTAPSCTARTRCSPPPTRTPPPRTRHAPRTRPSATAPSRRPAPRHTGRCARRTTARARACRCARAWRRVAARQRACQRAAINHAVPSAIGAAASVGGLEQKFARTFSKLCVASSASGYACRNMRWSDASAACSICSA